MYKIMSYHPPLPLRFDFTRGLLLLLLAACWLRTTQATPVGGAEQARRMRQDADGALPGVLPDERPRQERLRQERTHRRG